MTGISQLKPVNDDLQSQRYPDDSAVQGCELQVSGKLQGFAQYPPLAGPPLGHRMHFEGPGPLQVSQEEWHEPQLLSEVGVSRAAMNWVLVHVVTLRQSALFVTWLLTFKKVPRGQYESVCPQTRRDFVDSNARSLDLKSGSIEKRSATMLPARRSTRFTDTVDRPPLSMAARRLLVKFALRVALVPIRAV